MDCYNFSVMVFAQLFFSKCMNKRMFPLDRKRWVIANGDLSIKKLSSYCEKRTVRGTFVL